MKEKEEETNNSFQVLSSVIPPHNLVLHPLSRGLPSNTHSSVARPTLGAPTRGFTTQKGGNLRQIVGYLERQNTRANQESTGKFCFPGFNQEERELKGSQQIHRGTLCQRAQSIIGLGPTIRQPKWEKRMPHGIWVTKGINGKC